MPERVGCVTKHNVGLVGMFVEAECGRAGGCSRSGSVSMIGVVRSQLPKFLFGEAENLIGFDVSLTEDNHARRCVMRAHPIYRCLGMSADSAE